MFGNYCAIHGEEPIPPMYYRVCGECGHAFLTREELEELDHARAVECGLQGDPQPAEQISTCPMCTHDF